MDKLEHYLDQVCRSIGGPRSMREHVRQELREHLRDAVAEHKAVGMSEEAALDRALADFGGPEQMRQELEATHGHRLLPVVIDKAMQWKERTMKAKWLWMTWAYLALGVVIVLEILLITFNVIFIIPKFKKLLSDGMIDSAGLEEDGLTWMVNFLHELEYAGGHFTTWMLLAAIAAIGLFEWQVRSEHKPFIRLAALGSVAVGLMVVIGLMVLSLVIPFCVAMPAMGVMSRPWAVEQTISADVALTALEQAQAKKDWVAMADHATQLRTALNRLSAGPALTSLSRRDQQGNLADLRARLRQTQQAVGDVQQAIRDHDTGRLEAALGECRKAFEPIRDAAKRPAS